MTLRCFGSVAIVLAALVACHGSPPSSAGPQPIEPDSYGGDHDEATRQMPADHTVDWMRRHGAMSMGQGDDCATCHTEQDCITCHVESLDQPWAVHPPNYEVVHASDAEQGVQDCASCHRLDTFCEACHVEAGVSPRLEATPPSTVQFHPDDWLDPAAPRNHATEARRDIQDCATCHTERDCITCHQGINPHPPEFQFECASMLDADPSSCARCHTESVDVLQQMCM